MRLTRAMGDVTIGTLIVIVHSAIAGRLPRPKVEAGEPRDHHRGLRRVSWPRPAADRRASGRPR